MYKMNKKTKIIYIILSLLLVNIGYGYNYNINDSLLPYEEVKNLTFTVNNYSLINITTNSSRFINLTNLTINVVNYTELNISFKINVTNLTLLGNYSDGAKFDFYYCTSESLINCSLNKTEHLSFDYDIFNGSMSIQTNITISNITIIINSSITTIEVNYTKLPFSGQLQFTIDAPVGESIYYSCFGFINCPPNRVVSERFFNQTINFTIPSGVSGTFNHYVVMTVLTNKTSRLDFIFKILDAPIIGEVGIGDIKRCLELYPLNLTNLEEFIISCINYLVNESSVIYKNETVVKYIENVTYQPVVKMETIDAILKEREGFQIMEKERNVWMEIAKNLTIIVEAWQLRWMEANEQRIIEKSTYDKRIVNKGKNNMKWVMIGLTSLIVLFVINYIYKSKSLSSHSLFSEIRYLMLRR